MHRSFADSKDSLGKSQGSELARKIRDVFWIGVGPIPTAHGGKPDDNERMITIELRLPLTASAMISMAA